MKFEEVVRNMRSEGIRLTHGEHNADLARVFYTAYLEHKNDMVKRLTGGTSFAVKEKTSTSITGTGRRGERITFRLHKEFLKCYESGEKELHIFKLALVVETKRGHVEIPLEKFAYSVLLNGEDYFPDYSSEEELCLFGKED